MAVIELQDYFFGNLQILKFSNLNKLSQGDQDCKTAY